MPDACLSGGKDGKVIFWNENMSSVIRELLIDQSSFMAGHPSKNLPCIRAIDFQVSSFKRSHDVYLYIATLGLSSKIQLYFMNEFIADIILTIIITIC